MFIACLFAASCVAGAEASGWERVTEHAGFSPRDTAEDAVFQGKMWLSNGYYHGNVLHRDLWRSEDGADWTLVSDATPYDGYSELAVYKDRLWAVKGSVWNSTDGITWKQVAAETPFGVRGYGELVVFKDRLWQLGSGADAWHTADGKTWTCATADAAYGGRACAAVAVYDGALWVMGGRTTTPNDPPEAHYEEYTTHNDVWRSTDGENWTRVTAAAPWSPRMWFVAAVYQSRLWIIGGFDNRNGANLGDVWYTEDGADWHRFPVPEALAARHEPTCYVTKGSLWVVAGNTWPVVNDVWRLTLEEPPAPR